MKTFSTYLKQLLRVIAFTLFLAACMTTAAKAQKSTRDFYYHPPAEKIYLDISPEKILVKFKPSVTPAEARAILSKEKSIAAVKDEMFYEPLGVYILDLNGAKDGSDAVQTVERLRQAPGVQYANPFMSWRGGKLQASINRILVGLKDHTGEDALRSLSQYYHLTNPVRNAFDPRLYHLELTENSPGDALTIANKLFESGQFEYAQPDFLLLNLLGNTNDPLLGTQWALNNTGSNSTPAGTAGADMKVFAAWATTTGSTNIKVAIIDSGVDLAHPDLVGNLLPGYGASGNGSGGNTVGYGNDAHGTACAGIVAATGNNNLGVAGVAYSSKIIPVQVFVGENTTESWLADGINWAWQNGADVLSNSWGGGSPNAAINNAISDAVNNGRGGLGCVVLFATGNDNGEVSYPASNPLTIAVGGTSMCDERKNPFSCDGESWGANFGTNIDVSAPCVKIQTTDISGAGGYVSGDYIPDFNGTSSACPNAAGVMALILSVNPTLTQAQARAILEGTCDKTGGYTYNYGVAGQPHGSWSNDLGHGRVNAAKALAAAANPDDIDMDGFTVAGGDCDDFNPNAYPNAVEVCDGVDNNCNGFVDEGFDMDNDGYTSCGGDCDDNNPDIYPGATEICDGADNNCDGIVDFPPVAVHNCTQVPVAIPTLNTNVTSTLTIAGAIGNILDINVKDLKIRHTYTGDLRVTLTSPGGTVITLFDRPGVPASQYGCDQYNILATFDDAATLTAANFETTCNPSNSATTYAISGAYRPVQALAAFNGTSPNGAWTLTVRDFEEGDGGSIEEWGLEITTPTTTTYYADTDGDTYGDPNNSIVASFCPSPAGYVLDNTDCDDTNPDINPGATEICDGADNNCDGIVDFPSVAVHNSANVPLTISNMGAPTVTSTLTIAGATGNIVDINVKDLKILHSWVGDLRATLTSPGGAVITLFDRPGNPASTNGCPQNNILATFDDAATLTAANFENTCNLSNSPTTYAISGAYRPVDALAAYNGTTPNGTWTLTVRDFVNGDGGSIEEWGLEITTSTTPTTYYADMDGDTYGDPNNSITVVNCTPPAGYVLDNTDCNDTNPNINPGATEICDGVDNNCSGTVDDATTLNTYYRDIDGDGLGDPNDFVMACTAPAGYVTDNTDACPLTISSVSNTGNCGCQPGSYPIITVMSGQNVITGCASCPAGSYCPDGLSNPIPCPMGTFSNINGQAACSSCPGNNTFTVNDLGDTPDATPGDGVCNDGTGKCTLRAAIQEANALANNCSPLIITFSVTGTINLGGVLPDVLHPDITLQGPGASLLTVRRNSGGNYRLFNFIRSGGVATVSNLTLTNGNEPGFGGAIRTNPATLTVNDCIITGNQAGTGGGVSAAFGGVLTINRCLIENNSASQAAGVYVQAKNSLIQNTIIRNNISNSTGGVRNNATSTNATMTLINTQISDNTAMILDAAIRSEGATGGTSAITLINCTVTRNSTTDAGQPGAVWQRPDGVTHSLTVHNSIVTGNTSGGAPSDFSAVLESASAFNLVGVGSGLTNGVNGNLVGADPLFVNAAAGDFRLQACSPAINAGSNAAVPMGVSTDLDGNARIFGSVVDMGAYELQAPFLPVVAICQSTDVVLNSSGEASLSATALNNGSTGCGPLSFTLGGQPSLNFTCADLGSNTVMLTVTDVKGNSSNCTTTVRVLDNTQPTITCPATQTLTLGANCMASLPNYTGLATTGDNCGVQSLVQSPEPGTPVSGAGNMTVTLTVTDVNNLTNSCTFTVTKVDNTPPTVTCSNQAITFNGQPSIALNANDLVTASDNCGIASITLSPDVIECDRVGQVVPVTITVTDVNTNLSTCMANVTVGGLPCGWSQNADGVGCTSGNSIAFNPATAVWTATSTNCYYAPPFNSDSHGFAQRQLCGNNGSITVRIDNINGQGWAGIVMRETNAPGAKKAQLMTNLNSFNRMEFRAITDAQAYPQQIPFSNRRWLRIVRTGNQFQMFTSLNGTTWQFAGAQNIVMANCIQVGLVLTNFSANNTVSATFSMLEVQGSNVPLGLPGNGVAELAPHLSPLTPDFSPLTPDFSVFPNPTSGELNLDLTQYVGRSVRIETYSLEGKLLQFTEVDEVQTTLERLDLKGFQSGMYLVKVKSASLPDVTRRVVKQ